MNMALLKPAKPKSQDHLHLVPHNLHKLSSEAPILQHFHQGAHILFLQELNYTPRPELPRPGVLSMPSWVCNATG